LKRFSRKIRARHTQLKLGVNERAADDRVTQRIGVS
jgi:hypothetical protein